MDLLLFPTARQWQDLWQAWRERATNPIAQHFGGALQRRLAGLPLWRRALIFLPGLAMALCAYFFLATEGGPSGRDWSWKTTLYCMTWAGISLVWPFLAQLGISAVADGYGLLAAASTKRVLAMQVDDALATASLSDEEVLIGFLGAHWLPLIGRLWFAAPLVLPWFVALAEDAGTSSAYAASQTAVMFAPLTIVGIWLGGALGLLLTLLLCVVSGRGARSLATPGAVASVYWIGGYLLTMLTTMATFGIAEEFARQRSYRSEEPLLLGLSLLTFMALIGLMLLSARVSSTIRNGLPYGVLGLSLGTAVLIIVTSRQHGGNMHFFMDWVTTWAQLMPLNATAAPALGCYGIHRTDLGWLAEMRWPMLLATQLLMVLMLLRAALDAIAARRRGED